MKLDRTMLTAKMFPKNQL